MPNLSASGAPPSQRKIGDAVVGGGREVGAKIAAAVGVRSPQQVIAGALAGLPATNAARRITGQSSGKEVQAVARQLQRWAKGDRAITGPQVDKLIKEYPGAASALPALTQIQAQLAGKVRPPLALPSGASMRIYAKGTSRFVSGAGEPEIRNNHGATFPVENAQGDTTQREVDRALGDPIAYWLAAFQIAADGIEYLSIDALEIRVSY